MELNKMAIKNVKFKSRGKWYLSQQVDEYMCELSEAVGNLNSENSGLKEQLSELEAVRAENARLKTQVEELKSKAKPDMSIEHKRRVCEELEQDRDRLIESIGMLRSFREAFSESVKQDIKKLSESVEGMESYELL